MLTHTANIGWCPPTEGLGGKKGLGGRIPIRFSPPQVERYWQRAAKVAGKAGEVDWRYYDPLFVGLVEGRIAKIAKTPVNGAYPSITILGYSNGGDAALQLATYLKAQHVIVDLAITCDPVPKPVPADFIPFARSSWSTGGAMKQPCPGNVTHWYNFYQQFPTEDTAELAKALHLPTNIWGRTVAGADTNTEVTDCDFGADPIVGRIDIDQAMSKAHLYMPMLEVVRHTITDGIKELPQGKRSYYAV